ncbi:hypothetical protein AB4138_17320 [Vibrio sp. 10N.286.52.C3]|uniref:hypothetical protein n=1 Tax=Vibrio sp. 10N.286.52.C3 TaxID=3229713 RepID=UPI00354FBBC2
MKKPLTAFIAVLALGVTGCESTAVSSITNSLSYTTGVEITEQQLSKYTPNTTKDEIISEFGYPSKKEMFGTVEVWRYHYVFIPPLPGQKNINEDTVFEWNNNSKLIKSYKTASLESIL